MNDQHVWNSLEVVKLIVAMATPVAVALIGLWINRSLSAQGELAQKARDAEENRREAEREALHRTNEPHIELRIDCHFHGIRADRVLVTFVVTARNAGNIRQTFKPVTLTVRGIEDEPFTFIADTARVKFDRILKTDLVPWNYIFVEPGVTEQVTYTTTISANVAYLLAHVKFEYGALTPHTAESVFKVPALVP